MKKSFILKARGDVCSRYMGEKNCYAPGDREHLISQTLRNLRLPKHADELLSFSQNSEAQDPVLVGLQVSF